ncbi:MAG: cation transporter [Oscillospiraceae bacterium]|nr:cation transporter [Oscillospiraceae bacterium]MBR6208334.1 cation transporter [Oscillospiraceae bacterium]
MTKAPIKEKAGGADPAGFEKTATRVSLVSIAGNVVLSLFKLLAGVLGHSMAMVSDAIHSASDVVSSIIVIVGVNLSAREPDKSHPYGHERFECVAAIVLSVVLAFTGILIGRSALEQIVQGADGGRSIPGALALVAAAVSIVCKEAMYWYTRHYARQLDSASLMASAWDHRSDALSSVGALVGIFGARHGAPVLEPVASLLICVLILKAALDSFRGATEKMVDHACDDATEDAIRACAEGVEDVLRVDRLMTREFGARIYVDMEIAADENMTLIQGHEVAERVHDTIERQFPKVKHIMVHVNPGKP